MLDIREGKKDTLKDIDTSKIHYVRPPKNHIVIDFDLKDKNGLHLHYIYNGD